MLYSAPASSPAWDPLAPSPQGFSTTCDGLLLNLMLTLGRAPTIQSKLVTIICVKMVQIHLSDSLSLHNVT